MRYDCNVLCGNKNQLDGHKATQARPPPPLPPPGLITFLYSLFSKGKKQDVSPHSCDNKDGSLLAEENSDYF